MAAKKKSAEEKDSKKEIDVNDIDNQTVSSLATKPVDDLTESDDFQTIDNPDATDDDDDGNKVKTGSVKQNPVGWAKDHANLYLILFIAVVIISTMLVILLNNRSNQGDDSKINFEGTELNQDALDDLLASETNVGTVDQTLTVAANAIFNGKILVKDNLEVAGAITVGGALSLPGITVAGDSNFENVEVNNSLSILGSATIQQSLSIQQGLNVTGNASVGGSFSAGSISADNISFTGDLNLTRHINTTGGTPGISKGTAVGSGGTVSVSGNDIAGTITINTGGGPPAGVLARLTFVSAYSSTPSIQITPVNSGSASLNYYVTRDTGSFSIGTSNAPSSSKTYTFDYYVTQ